VPLFVNRRPMHVLPANDAFGWMSCVEAKVAKDAKGVSFDEFAAFAKCRHSYFKKWTYFFHAAMRALSQLCWAVGVARAVPVQSSVAHAEIVTIAFVMMPLLVREILG